MSDVCEKCGVPKSYHDSGEYYSHTTGKMDGCRVTFPAMSTKPSPTPEAKLYKTTGYHIEVDGEVFKSQGAAGYGGGDSTLSDKHRREVAALIVRAVNNHERLVEALREMLHYADWHARGRSEANDSDECKRARALLSELEQEAQ